MERMHALLGPTASWRLGEVDIVEQVDCEEYVRRLVSYDVPCGRASAFVCIPRRISGPAPVVYCHHQHGGRFDLGKSEVLGLRGDADQAYAAELAAHGFVTVAADAIGFEDRNWANGQNVSWFELSSRLVAGRTLLADQLQEISLAISYAITLPEADQGRVGFIGHSFGGRMALWAPTWDPRITVSVSNCGCIPYRYSFTHDAGMQADFVVPRLAVEHDLEDVISLADQCSLLVIAAEDDVWSRGAADLDAFARQHAPESVTVQIRPGGHAFPPEARHTAYEFLSSHLTSHRPGHPRHVVAD